MFRCPITGKVSVAGEKPMSIVLEKRARVYYDTPDGREPGPNFYATDRWSGSEVGRGTEIVREVLVSKQGLDQVEARTAA